MKIIILFFIGISFYGNTYAQKNYALIGTDRQTYRITHIFRFEVVNSESNWQIPNARISLIDNDYKVFDIYTNQEGVGIAIFVTSSSNTSFYGGDLKVVAQNQRPLERYLEQTDYIHNGERIILLNRERNEYIEDSSIDFETLLSCLEDNRFEIYKYEDNWSYIFYEYYEIRIVLDKIPETLIINNSDR